LVSVHARYAGQPGRRGVSSRCAESSVKAFSLLYSLGENGYL
jgi:hypothetical protein